ncbi:MAG TPA: alpha/beta hydrolase [Acidimicrobiia bacterium]|nr:alpha/beta hydrolase [Acidimicrobiia bacterium]
MPRPTLLTADGVTLAGRRWLVEPAPAAAVVIVHGFSASSECPQVEALAEALHGDGLDVVTYDARGHGCSDGESTLGDHEQHDVAAAVALARERTPHVILVGASMGAIATLRYAVTDAALCGAVAVSCPAEWRLPRNARGILAAAMTRTPVGRRITSRLTGVRVAGRWTNPEPPLALAPRLQVPVTYVHGTDDKFIPVHDAAVLARATVAPRNTVIVRGMGHAFEPIAIEPIREAVAWTLARELDPAP